MQYVVKSGDNLSTIGAKLGVSWASIANANGIKPPYRIYPGQRLEVPGSGGGGVVSGPPVYSGQPITPIPSSSSNSSSNLGGAADFTSPLSMIINGVLLYGIFKVVMKVL